MQKAGKSVRAECRQRTGKEERERTHMCKRKEKKKREKKKKKVKKKSICRAAECEQQQQVRWYGVRWCKATGQNIAKNCINKQYGEYVVVQGNVGGGGGGSGGGVGWGMPAGMPVKAPSRYATAIRRALPACRHQLLLRTKRRAISAVACPPRLQPALCHVAARPACSA